jgi:DNA-directed RNA polymerase specialized sigma24 family protein
MESPEAFEAFLLWLSQGKASGAQQYEEVRQKLILLFRCRGCVNPEELTDETIDRTARAVLRPDFTYVGDPLAYFRGVARNVYFEWHRKQRKLAAVPIDDAHRELLAKRNNEPDVLSDYIERCLNELPRGKKSLLLRYYESNKQAKIDGRQLLADKEGIGLNALRIQIFRLRNAVRQCVERHNRHSEIQQLGTTSNK